MKLKLVIVAAGLAPILGGCVGTEGTAVRERASLADRDTPSSGLVPGQLPD
ncbi:hypothetical protein [Jiella pacifica]|uniref:Uncharacterized protein n=1 Tax=Jiella pacifica TaxID=2696469 RepID=A0A6N9T370_9HYPH|nr:hypothetical protein [Jiella pacifica]NDW05720.1 hypothetical protein [Jiella pacifica]